MSARHVELARRIRVMLPDLEREWQQALDAWSRLATEVNDRRVFLASAAFSAHGFYTGVERLMEVIARRLDGSTPTGEVWHQELLYRMRSDVPGLRPPVISDDTALRLDKLRRFRHIVRNVYPSELEEDRAAEVFGILPSLWPKLRVDLEAFAEFLDSVPPSL